MDGAKKIKQGETSAELTFSDIEQWVKNFVPSGTYDTYPFDAQALFDAVRSSIAKSVHEFGVERFKQHGNFFDSVCSLSKKRRIEILQEVLLSKDEPSFKTKRVGKEFVLYENKQKDVYPLVKKFFNMLSMGDIQEVENVLMKTVEKIDEVKNLKIAENIIKKYARHLDSALDDISFLSLIRFGKIFKLAKLIEKYEFSDYYEKANIDEFVNFVVDIGICLHYVHITEDNKEKIESNQRLLDLLKKLNRITASIHRDVGKSSEYNKHASIFYNKIYLKSKKISKNDLNEKI